MSTLTTSANTSDPQIFSILNTALVLAAVIAIVLGICVSLWREASATLKVVLKEINGTQVILLKFFVTLIAVSLLYLASQLFPGARGLFASAGLRSSVNFFLTVVMISIVGVSTIILRGKSAQMQRLKLREAKSDESQRGGVSIVLEQNVGDTYNIGQAAAAGRNATASHTTMQQVTSKLGQSVDLVSLADQLSQLRAAMRKEAVDPEHDNSVAAIGGAEKSARAGDTTNVVKYLGLAGKWALDAATKLGTDVAVEAIKQSMGLE